MESLRLIVKSLRDETDDIRSFELVDEQGEELPSFMAGAHIDVRTPDGDVRQYSLCNDPADRDCYRLGILREPTGRGGSVSMHESVQVGTELTTSVPRNNFPLHEAASRHVLIAGGIGITPMLSMALYLSARSASFELHYCARAPETTAFLGCLENSTFSDCLYLHFDGGDPSQGINLASVLGNYVDGVHLYCCGPIGLLNAVREQSSHWPAGTVHFEHFIADPVADEGPNKPFKIEIASTGACHVVPADKTILQILEENGLSITKSCEEGLCGSCITGVLEGEPDHRDLVLDDEEKESGTLITVCCSRARSPRLKLDL